MMEISMKLDVVFEKANVILKEKDLKQIIQSQPLTSIKFLKEKAMEDLLFRLKRKISNKHIYDNFKIDFDAETKKWILVATYDNYHGSGKEIKDIFNLTEEENNEITKTLEMFQVMSDFFI